jgi:hypothetical protein
MMTDIALGFRNADGEMLKDLAECLLGAADQWRRASGRGAFLAAANIVEFSGVVSKQEADPPLARDHG